MFALPQERKRERGGGLLWIEIVGTARLHRRYIQVKSGSHPLLHLFPFFDRVGNITDLLE